MFGQYSAAGGARLTKAELVSAASATLKAPVTRSRLAGHNRLHVFAEDGSQHFVFHSTVIASLSADGALLTLNDGGWPTMATRHAISDACAAFGLGHQAVWGAKPAADHAINGILFNRRLVVSLPVWRIEESDAGAPLMVRASEYDDGSQRFEVTYDGAEIRSNGLYYGSANPYSVMVTLGRMSRMATKARREHRDPFLCGLGIRVLLGHWAAPGRFGRTIHVGCHTFKTTDLRAALRTLEARYPAEAKRARVAVRREIKAETKAEGRADG